MSLSISQTTFAEPQAGTAFYTVTMTRSDTTQADEFWEAYFYGQPYRSGNFVNSSDIVVNRGDYFYTSGVFSGNSSTVTFQVGINADALIEGSETAQFQLYSETNGFSYSTVTITDPISTGELAINSPAAVAEGNSGSTFIDFTVTRSGSTSGVASASYTVAGSGANPANTADFNTSTYPLSGTVNFAAGASTATIRVAVAGDTVIEPSETFTVTLSNPSNATIAINGGVGTGTIVNDDFAGSFSVGDVTVAEGDTGSTSNQFIVTRTNGAAPATIAYTIVDAGSSAQTTATFGSDYTAARSGTITFAAGQTSATVPFTVIGDAVAEGNETFRLQLSNPSSGGTISRGVGTATIIDNDGAPPPVAPNTPGLQQGTSGGDVLISTNQGNSILAGGRGDDTYLVYSQGDVVIEAVNEGQDILYTTVSYSLGENQVEAMSVAQQTSTNAINLIGNYVSQIIVGNYGDNVLNGGSGGVDTLVGLFGNDTYAVGDARTVIVEQAGQGFDTAVTSVSYTLGAGVSVEVFAAQNAASTTGLRLGGNELAQTIAGTAGAYRETEYGR